VFSGIDFMGMCQPIRACGAKGGLAAASNY
jgi:hypothetical protein